MPEKEELTAQPKNMWDTSAPGNRDYMSLFKGSANHQAVEPMLDAAAVSVGTRMLDIGTGLHAIAVGAALQRGAVPTGSDVGENLIALTKEEFPGVEFKAADAADLPFADASFDAVVCGFSVFAFTDPEKAFEEAYRVLAPGGKIACTTWDWPVPGFDVFHEAMAEYVPDEPILPGNRPLMNVSDTVELNDYLLRAGFLETAVQRLPLVWLLDSPDHLFDALASLRSFEGLDPQTLQKFRSDVAKASAIYKRDDRYEYPFPALLMSGTKSQN
jgi:ubiquinone/menaquinone biosynthesis C-methylase UbiE